MREFLSRHVFSPLQGMTAGRWWSLLRQNRASIDPPYWPRACFQSAVSVSNSALAAAEAARFGRESEAVRVPPLLFILGHFRSGTSHLHNLLALDPQFAFPNLYQTLYPLTFLTTEGVVPRLGKALLLRTRPHDGMAIDFGVPNEDELAVLNDSGLSPYLAWVFPRRAEAYDRFLTFRDVPAGEVELWKSSLLRFLKKLTLRNARPLVLKSPPHTARIRLLREMFPDARFVHIRRDPFTVFRSTQHMYAATMSYWRFQRPPTDDPDDRIFSAYREMYDAYFDQRATIPAGHLCELAYEDLERDPVGQVEFLYRTLGLAGVESVRPRLEAYLASILGYRKNRHPDLPEPLRRRVSREWVRCFDEWGTGG